ncbi:MAG: cytochrome o ubiquinol oxidase subunit IV [Pseudomonadota bacterium]
MSQPDTTLHHGSGEGHDDHASHGSLKSYAIGFALSVVLTVIPFWLVMGNVLDTRIYTLLIIFALGAVQMVVHLHYFMHITARAEDGWQFMALIFTAVLIVIIMAGSLWIMLTLHDFTMPSHEQIDTIRQL